MVNELELTPKMTHNATAVVHNTKGAICILATNTNKMSHVHTRMIIHYASTLKIRFPSSQLNEHYNKDIYVF